MGLISRVSSRTYRFSSNMSTMPRRRLNIAMVSGFFYPNIGGIETHIFELSRHLIERGHHVIVITHQYPRFQGVHYMLKGRLKVYYLSFPVMFRNCIWTNLIN